MDRKSILVSLRPEISYELKYGEMSPEEKFQNEVLRPILKFQHELLSSVFNVYLRKKNIDTTKWDTPTKEKYIQKILSHDLILRNTLIGMIIGMMDEAEFLIYSDHEPELRNRISRMIGQRVISQI